LDITILPKNLIFLQLIYLWWLLFPLFLFATILCIFETRLSYLLSGWVPQMVHGLVILLLLFFESFCLAFFTSLGKFTSSCGFLKSLRFSIGSILSLSLVSLSSFPVCSQVYEGSRSWCCSLFTAKTKVCHPHLPILYNDS